MSLIGSTILILNGSMIVFMTASSPRARRDVSPRLASPDYGRSGRATQASMARAMISSPCDTQRVRQCGLDGTNVFMNRRLARRVPGSSGRPQRWAWFSALSAERTRSGG